jgi:hypothetical protein
MAVSVWKVTALIMKLDTTSNEVGESDTAWERYMECGTLCVHITCIKLVNILSRLVYYTVILYYGYLTFR